MHFKRIDGNKVYSKEELYEDIFLNDEERKIYFEDIRQDEAIKEVSKKESYKMRGSLPPGSNNEVIKADISVDGRDLEDLQNIDPSILKVGQAKINEIREIVKKSDQIVKVFKNAIANGQNFLDALKVVNQKYRIGGDMAERIIDTVITGEYNSIDQKNEQIKELEKQNNNQIAQNKKLNADKIVVEQSLNEAKQELIKRDNTINNLVDQNRANLEEYERTYGEELERLQEEIKVKEIETNGEVKGYKESINHLTEQVKEQYSTIEQLKNKVTQLENSLNQPS